MLLQTISIFALAMGNWVNTASPELDEHAPAAVGNCGELILQQDDKEWQLDIDRAHLEQSKGEAGQSLHLQGESWGGNRLFDLRVDLPVDWQEPDEKAGIPQLCKCENTSSSRLNLDGEANAIETGHLELWSVTGSGPWEIDGEVFLRTEGGDFTGRFEARVQA